MFSRLIPSISMDWSAVTPTIKKIGFDDVMFASKNLDAYILINTLNKEEQNILIKGTTPFHLEEEKINNIIDNVEFDKYKIVIYGKNSTDSTIESKHKQLKGLGFIELYVYYGGLFEWMLLQDVYGKDFFDITSNNDTFEKGTINNTFVDVLHWKPSRIFV